MIFSENSKTGLNKKIKSVFIVDFLVIFVSYAMFLSTHYSVDSYTCFYNTDPEVQLRNGRWVNYILLKITNFFNINLVTTQSFFTFAFICVLAFVTIALSFRVYTAINSENFVMFLGINFSILITFINVFILEWFLYPECILFYICALLTCLASIFIITKKQTIMAEISAGLLLLISLLSYQATISLFVIWSLTIISFEENFRISSKSIKKGISILLVGFTSSAIAAFLPKIISPFNTVASPDRSVEFSFQKILNNVKTLIWAQKRIWNDGFGLLPRYFLIIVFAVLIIFIFVYILRKKCFSQALWGLMVLVINYIIVFAPHIIAPVQWYAQRTIVGYFAFFSFLFLVTMKIFQIGKIGKKSEAILISLLTIFILVNITQIQAIGTNHFSINKMDKAFALNLENIIEKYEKENSVKIRNISIVNDIFPSYSYPGIEYSILDTNISAFSVPFAAVDALNYYTGNSYQKIPMNNKIYDEHFSGKNWDYFNINEQMIFQEDSLYLIMN